MSPPESSRRAVLRGALGGSVAGLGGVAGCLGSALPGGGSSGTKSPPPPPESWDGDSPQYQFDAAHTGRSDAPGPGATRPGEHFALPDETPDVGRVRPPAVVDGTAYVTMGGEREGTVFSLLLAVDVRTGIERWRQRVDGSRVETTPTMPVVHEDTVYFGSGEMFYAHTTGGDRLWATEQSFESSTRPTVAQNRIVVEDNTTMYGIDTDSGQRVWSYDVDTTTSNQPAIFVRTPAVENGTVYVCGSHLEAVRLADGTNEWTAEFPSRTMSGPTVGPNAVYLTTRAGEIRSHPKDGGDPFWTASVADDLSGVRTELALGDGRVVARLGTFEGLVVVDTQNGDRQWKVTPRTTGSPVVSGGVVYVPDVSKLLAYDEASGDRLWKYNDPVSGGAPEPAVVSDNYAFLVVGGQKLACLRTK